MQRKVYKLRLSPNEEAQLVRDEQERRRKLRIQQVREQQRFIAHQIRQNVERKRQRELGLLEEKLRKDWEQQQREKLITLQNMYHESLSLVGQGHRSAKENEPDWEAIAQREEENQAKAEQRFREALRELQTQKLKDNENQRRTINAKIKALQAEKERAARVSSLPPPPPNVVQSIVSKRPPVRRRYGVGVYGNTYFHMSTTKVDREDSDQPNAQEMAKQEARRLENLEVEEEKKREEQMETARFRGQQALKKEKDIQDRERLLVELEHLQQTDMLRRRQQVSLMPPHIIQPLYERQEKEEDFQMQLEFAFEDMYKKERRVEDDMVLQLLPEPLPPLLPSPGLADNGLDITHDDIVTVYEVNVAPEAPREDSETTSQVDPSRATHRQVLRKLLDRIRDQTNQPIQCTSQSSLIPVDELPADQIPEKDTSIESGLLSNEERGPLALPPSLTEEDGESSLADERIPESVSDSHSERGKGLLELEKQQQVLLLQELEEQKTQLEQMLVEAQQERDSLKTAVSQEAPADGPEPVAEDQESTRTPEIVPCTSEDDHTRTVRQYQMRLLEQDRVHQMSVQAARQRLRDYQRALQIRYSMSAAPAGTTRSHVTSRSHLCTEHSTSLHVPCREGAEELNIHPYLSPSLVLHQPTSHHASSATQSHVHPGPAFSANVPTRDSRVSALHMFDSSLPVPAEAARNRTVAHHGSDQLSLDALQKVQQHLTATKNGGINSSRQLLAHSGHETKYAARDEVPQDIKQIEENSLKRKLQRAEKLLQQTQQEMEIQRRELQKLWRQRELEEEAKRILAQRRLEENAQRQLEERKAQHLQEVQQAMRQQDEEQLRGFQEALLLQRLEVMERQQEAQEAQKLLEDGQRNKVQVRQRQLEMERQELVVQETRRVLEQREEEIQLRLKLEEAQRLLQERKEDMERQSQELQKVRRLMEQRSLEGMEARRQQEEGRADREQQEKGKGPVPALSEGIAQDEETQMVTGQTFGSIHNLDHRPQLTAEVTGGALDSVRQARLKILGSLLKVIDESEGGILSHLAKEGEQKEVIHQENPSTSVSPGARTHVVKPPVTRVRLDKMKRHELSAIQEVDSPVNISQFADQEEAETSQAARWLEEWSSSHSSDRFLQITTESGQRHHGSTSDELTWRDRLLMGVGTPLELSDSERTMLTPSSDSGRGADYSGPAVTTVRSPTEVTRLAESLCNTSALRSSHSVSSNSSPGVSISKDPAADLQINEATSQQEQVSRLGPDSVSSFNHSPCTDNSPSARSSAPSVESMFSENSIQRIIDRYTRELDVSLSSAGRLTDPEGSTMEDPGPSVSQNSFVALTPRPADVEDSILSDQPASSKSLISSSSALRSSHSVSSNSSPGVSISKDPAADLQINPESSTMEDPGPSVSQNSFVALTPRPADVEDSSLSDQPASSKSLTSSSDLTDIPIPEHLSASGEASGGAELGQDSFKLLVGQLDLSSFVPVDHQQSHFEHLVGQPFAQSSMIGQPPVPGSSVLRCRESTRGHMMGWLSNQTSSLWTSGGQNLHTGQPMSETDPQTSWMREESMMRPLVWELDESSGRNETSSDRSLLEVSDETTTTTAAPLHPSIPPEAPSLSPAPASQDQHRECQVTAEGSFFALLPEVTYNETVDPSMTFNPLEQEKSACHHEGTDPSVTSPEHFRASKQDHDVELMTLSVSNLDQCDVTATLMQQHRDSVALTEELQSELNMATQEMMQIAPQEKGILDQSEITLVSLTDTTLQDSNGTLSEDEPEVTANKSADVSHESGVKEEQELSVTWGDVDQPDVYQQKRSALIQRSTRRVEDMRARRAEAKTDASGSTSGSTSASGTKAGAKTEIKSRKSFPENLHTTSTGVCSDSAPSTADQVKTFNPEQRKRDVLESRRRTQRLYKQLEEVKVLKAARSRQEENARNRLKAQEFHKKTLDKLRSKLPQP